MVANDKILAAPHVATVVLASGGKMGVRIAATDWSATPVGPFGEWPQSLWTALSLCLAAPQPMLLLWGSELTAFYNDAYAFRNDRDGLPDCLGRAGTLAWGTAEPAVREPVRRALEKGAAEPVPAPVNGFGKAERQGASWLLTPVRGEEGRVVGLLAARRSLTSRRPTKGDAAEELGRLRAALDARDELMAVAAHEVKTPLATLGLQVDSLCRALNRGRLDQLAPERLQEKSEIIRRQVERLAELVESVLDVSRMQVGHLDLRFERVDLVAVVEDAIERLRPALEAAGSDFASTVPSGPIEGDWDRVRLLQAITNLLGNAIKYGDGQPIEVVVEDLDEQVRVVVRDRGVGLEVAQLDRLFRAFERDAVQVRPSGLGLGLYITLGIVEAMSGTLRVESEPGAGSTFIVELPKCQDESKDDHTRR